MSGNAVLAATISGLAIDGELVLPGADVRRLAEAEGTLYAGGDGIFRSGDGGKSWKRVFEATVRALASTGDAIYAGLKPPRVVVTRDRGRSWQELPGFPRLRSWFWATPAERPYRHAAVHALAVCTDTVVAGIEAGALVVYDGRRWSGHRRGALRDCHDLALSSGRLFLAGALGCCAVSADGGRTWRRLNEGIDRPYAWSVTADHDDVYLFSARGPMRPGFVYRLDGETWHKVTGEVPGFVPLRAAGGRVHAGVGGEVWSSDDRGATWDRHPLGLGRVRDLLPI